MKAMLPGTQERIRLEVIKEVDSYFEKKCTDFDTMALWVLHAQFGFGKVRLRRYFENYIKKIKILQERYGDYTPDKMRDELKRIGVDVVAWEKEIK